jgi:hypothetical protein
MFASVHSRRKKAGALFLLNLGCELASSSRLVFVFHQASSEGDFDWCLGIRKDEESCINKESDCARRHLFGFGVEEEENKFLMIYYFLFSMRIVCISVLNKLQCLVALEGRMPQGVLAAFLKDKLFPLCFTSFNLMQLNTRCGSL